MEGRVWAVISENGTEVYREELANLVSHIHLSGSADPTHSHSNEMLRFRFRRIIIHEKKHEKALVGES